MAESNSTSGRELRTLLVRFPLEDRHIRRLRDHFPDLNVVVALADEEFLQHLPQAEAVVAWRLTPAEIAAAPRLRWLQTVGAGVEDVIVPELAERGIILTNNSGVHAPNISEHILAMMLAFARRLPFLIRGQLIHE